MDTRYCACIVNYVSYCFVIGASWVLAEIEYTPGILIQYHRGLEFRAEFVIFQ